MTSAQFEEKEYEGCLYHELTSGEIPLWPPGQVLENYLGFDVALLSIHRLFWSIHRISRPPRGVAPWYFPWPFVPRGFDRSRLPRFRYNCFIQSKRPMYGRRLSRRLSSLGPKRPFYRFSIESDQQATLEAAAARIGKRAIFCYAAPVFWRSQDLFSCARAQEIVDSSTFPPIGAVEAQHYWYYNRPGAAGIANRSFESSEMPSLRSRIDEIIAEHGAETEETESPSAALTHLAREIESTFKESNIGGYPRGEFLLREWQEFDEAARGLELPPAVSSYFRVSAFADFFNLAWFTIA